MRYIILLFLVLSSVAYFDQTDASSVLNCTPKADDELLYTEYVRDRRRYQTRTTDHTILYPTDDANVQINCVQIKEHIPGYPGTPTIQNSGPNVIIRLKSGLQYDLSADVYIYGKRLPNDY